MAPGSPDSEAVATTWIAAEPPLDQPLLDPPPLLPPPPFDPPPLPPASLPPLFELDEHAAPTPMASVTGRFKGPLSGHEFATPLDSLAPATTT